jgi:Aerotolerance regulator N-terminal
MIFLHPLVLLGLAAAAIPALLHLFERRVPPEAEFPALRYLSEAERRSARRLRLRHLLLLLLRTALIVLVVLAAARPLVPTRHPAATHPPTALGLVLDNSPSSGAVVGGAPTLDRLKAAARSVLQRAAPEDRLWLVLADGVVRRGTRQELSAAIDSASTDWHRLDLVAAVSRLGRIVNAEPVSEREIQVVSDLQRTALDSGRADVPAAVRVQGLAPRPAPVNRGIASARVSGPSVVATLVGSATAGSAPVTLRLRGRDASRALAAPGTSVALPFPVQPPGWWVGEVTLPPDELRIDDRRDVAGHEVPPAGVRAEAGSGPFVSAALAVLRDAGRVREGEAVRIGDRPVAGSAVVLPPEDPALVGQLNRALTARGIAWQLGAAAPPGLLTDAVLDGLDQIPVSRRYRLVGGDSGRVLARVNGDPWAVADHGVVLLGSRLDTAWTALPITPMFVPFVDALVNRFARGTAAIVEREGPPGVTFTTSAGDTVGATVYGIDPRESDLMPAAPALVRAALHAELVTEAAFGEAAFAGLRRADVSGLLLFMALLVALAELAAATLTR